MNIIYKKITKADTSKLRNLIDEVIGGLDNKNFFIPIDDEQFNKLFDEKSSLLYGAYDKDKLVAMAQLQIKEKDFTELKEILELINYRVAKMGRYLVFEEYRNNGIMLELQKILLNQAKINNFEYVITICHPDNIPSIKTILKAGLKLEKSLKKLSNGYIRNIYLKKLI